MMSVNQSALRDRSVMRFVPSVWSSTGVWHLRATLQQSSSPVTITYGCCSMYSSCCISL